MEAQSNVRQLEKITRIAHGRIPVSEESSVFNLFAQRREVCKKIIEYGANINTEVLLQYLEKIEENIKQYLCL